jgi:hypothetical protein
MTWIIKITYENDDSVSIEQRLTDTTVKHANFDVRVEAFKRLLAEMDKELKDENRRG